MVAINRRELIEGTVCTMSSMAVATSAGSGAARAAEQQTGPVDMTLTVNGELRTISAEPSTTAFSAASAPPARSCQA